MRRRSFLGMLLAAFAPVRAKGEAEPFALPLKSGSVRFAAIGDNGTGERPEFDVAAQMVKFRKTFPFDFVVMLGDNIYGGGGALGMKRKFEDPYKELLDGGVKFYASLGNHDDPNERFYKPFNMGGQRYYTFKNGNTQFFALDSTYMDRVQLDWMEKELSGSKAAWKICFFHHPLYSHGKTHGSDLDLRRRIEPLFQKYGVNVVLSGHDHIYERLNPQNGINYFVMGCAGELRPHDLAPSPDTAKGFDTDRAFMAIEVAGDEFWFQAVSRTGSTVDSGVIQRETTKATSAAA